MPIGLLFYILMLFWLVFSLWSHYPFTGPSYPIVGGNLLLFVLILLLGWHDFGSPVHG